MDLNSSRNSKLNTLSYAELTALEAEVAAAKENARIRQIDAIKAEAKRIGLFKELFGRG